MDKKNNNINIELRIVLIVLILIQLGRIVFSFVYLKEDFHSDELWSFGLSNSYYEPFIFQTADHDELINYDKWIPSQVMKDYLTVDKEHRFSYDSVYYNQVHDYHPPLYYFIFHTICSFFPGRFSPWYGFVINIVTFIFTVIFINKTLMEITDSKIVSIIGAAFYGFSPGAVNTFVFIRMYSLLTMLSVLLLYIHVLLHKCYESKNIFLLLFITTLSGCLTHHFFIPYAGLLAICFCLYYILSGNVKKFVVYSLTMLASVGMSLLLFPATIDHLFSGRIDDPKLPFSWQIKLTFNCMLKELFGLSVSVIPRISYTVIAIIIACVIIILSPLLFLFRKEFWFRAFVSKVKNSLLTVITKIKKANIIIIAIMVSSLGIILLTSLTVSLIMMWSTTDRYIFNIFPVISIGAISIIYTFLKNIIRNRKKAYAVLALVGGIFCFLANSRGCFNYYFTKPDDVVSVKEITENSNFVIVIEKDEFLLTCITKDFFDANMLYVTSAENLDTKIRKIIEAPSGNKSLYLFIENNSFYKEYEDGALGGKLPEMGRSADQSWKLRKEEFEEILHEKYPDSKYIGYDTVFARDFSIYKAK